MRFLREKLAALEHEQWCAWSRTLAETETLTPERLAEWRTLWVPYAQLSETEKDLDRKYADRVLAVLEREGLGPLNSASREKQP
jgi:hypothetical protein